MKRPVHIVVETGSLAGGVRVIGELANRLVARGWEVSIWSINPRETMDWFKLDTRIKWHSFQQTGAITDYQQLAGVLAKQKGIKIATFWRTAYAVADAVAEGNAEGEGYYLVQDVETSYVSQPILAANVLGSYEFGLRRLTTSRWVESKLGGCVYIGIGVDNFYTRLSKLRRMDYPLACARRQALKGWAELCEAARYLSQAGFPLVTYGLDKKLPMIAEHLHNADPRTLKPLARSLSDAQVREHYNQAGAFLSTSRHEGLSLTPLEAMACGCPVVMTPADGNLEYARNEENCLLVDTPAEVAAGVERVLGDRDLAFNLAQAGLATAKTYRWTEVVDRLETALAT